MRKILLMLCCIVSLQATAAKYNLVERTTGALLSLSENLYLYWIGSNIDNLPFEGSGTQNSPYLIKRYEHLAGLAYWVNVKHETFKGKYFKIDDEVNIITMLGNWVAIGIDENYPFEGYFDGNGKTIDKMTIEVESGTGGYCYGLFGHCKGYVRNLNITDAKMIFSINYSTTNTQSITAGLLCARLGMSREKNLYAAVYGCNVSGKSQITGIVTNGTTSYNFREDKTWIGGLVGFADNPVSIYRCRTDVRIDLRGAFDVGGIVGHICGYSVTQINWWQSNGGPLETFVFDCTAKVNMNVTKGYTNYYHAGGICGSNDGGNIEACAATGTVMAGEDGTAAGICGRNMGNIIACVATTTAIGGYNVGGIVGKNETTTIGGKNFDGEIYKCVYSGHIDGTNAQYAGGVAARCPGNRVHYSLFLGTMKASTVSTHSTPIQQVTGDSDFEVDHCYYDGNLCQLYAPLARTTFEKLTTHPLPNDIILEENEQEDEGLITLKDLYLGNKRCQVTGVSWATVSGFYPRIEVGSSNNTSAGTMTDTAIERAKNAWNDNTDLKTPILFPSYVWLTTVPGGFNNGHQAYYLDNAFSLADKSGSGKTATYSLTTGQQVLTVEGTTATPAEPGTTMLNITNNGLTKEFLLQVVYGNNQWDGTYVTELAGAGTQENPYLIHNARQMAGVMRYNNTDLYTNKYFKLTQDIWFNDSLLNSQAEPVKGKYAWDHLRDQLADKKFRWVGHLDGDGHLIRGLYLTNAYGIFEELGNNASIENVGFVNTYIKAPAYNVSSEEHPMVFLASEVSGTATVRNCLFEGATHPNSNGQITTTTAFCGNLNVTNEQIATIEDCIIAVTPMSAEKRSLVGNAPSSLTTLQRILVLAGNPEYGLANKESALSECYFPEGYFSPAEVNKVKFKDAQSVAALTNGTLWTDKDKWVSTEGRFPMLRSFADSDYGKLLSLPIYTTADNNLLEMKDIMPYEPGAATWSFDGDPEHIAVAVRSELELLEPLEYAGGDLNRTLEHARLVTRMQVVYGFQPGIKFEDNYAKTFCDTAFGNHDGTVMLSELMGVASSEFTTAMSDYSATANQIATFPELRYFATLDNLGTVFQNKEKLTQVTIPAKVHQLENDLFKGCTNMTSFTFPLSITTLNTHPFNGSAVRNFAVERNHPTLGVVDGILMNKEKTELVCYPNGRSGDAVHKSITLTGKIDLIRSNAIYKIPLIDTLFIDAPNHESFTDLSANGITHHTEGKMMVYVKDATNEFGGETGEGKGYLLGQYLESENWNAVAELHRYFDLEVSANSWDASKSCYWATMYIGFDTQLPKELTPYVVDKEKTNLENTYLYLRKIPQKVPMLTPVVIKATKAGTYRLLASQESKWEGSEMSINLLDGTNRNGMKVNQAESIEGGCLTLGRNSLGQIGFFLYKGTKDIPAYRAYLTVNKIGAEARMFKFTDEESTDIKGTDLSPVTTQDVYYNLNGQRVEHPTKGIYIHNGRKVIIK